MIRLLLNKGKNILLSNVLERIVSIIIFWLIAKNYGAGAYGLVVAIFTFSGILDIFFTFGFPVYIQREAAKDNNNINSSLLQILQIRLCLIIVFLIIAFVYFYIYCKEIPFYFIVIPCAVAVQSLNQIFNSYFKGKLKPQFILSSILISRTFLFITGLIAALLKFDLIIILTVIFISYSLQNYYLWKYYILESGISTRVIFEFIPKNKLKLCRICFPLALAGLFSFASDRADTIIISMLFGFKETGYYNAAYSIYKAPLFALSIILVPSLSIFAKYSSDKRKVVDESKRIIMLLFIIGLGVSLIFYMFAELFIRTLFTSDFTPSIKILQIFSISFLFISLNSFTGMLINSLNLNKPNVLILISALLINVILNLYLIPRIGIEGAAYSTILTEFYIVSAHFILLNQYFKEMRQEWI